MTLVAALKHSSERSGSKAAIAFGDQSWTFSEFDRLTDHIAWNLLAAGVEPGDRVALHLSNGPELALGDIGCLKAGCALVPVNTRLKGREVDYILRQSGSVFYLGQPDLYSEIAGTCPALSELHACYLTSEPTSGGISSFDDLLRRPVHADPLPKLAPDHVAAILYTSGTTARPKGVVHTHETFMQTARAMRNMELDENQVVLVMSSMAHMIGFGMLFLPALLIGATTVITRPFEFLSSLDAIARWRCTYTLGLPLMFKFLYERQLSAQRDVSSGRFYFCGGDCVSPALQETFQRSFAPLCEAYGATEITPMSWNRPDDIRVGSIGKPAAGIGFRLIDSRGVDVVPGQTGEICVQGPQLMRGYWHDAEATSAVFQGDWFRTGDLAHQDADGFYWFAGRKKEIIVRGGSNISPREVEAVLYGHPAVAEVAVVGNPHAILGETVVAHVALLPGQRLEEPELIAFARERLAEYKLPERVVFQSELPKGPTGKIQKHVLREAQRAITAEASALQLNRNH
jgi:long-chain acyl-CoA synthetase